MYYYIKKDKIIAVEQLKDMPDWVEFVYSISGSQIVPVEIKF